MTATIIDIFDKMIKDPNLNENEREILKLVMIANCSIKSAAMWPAGRDGYLIDCREKLERALVYLNDEIDNDKNS